MLRKIFNCVNKLKQKQTNNNINNTKIEKCYICESVEPIEDTYTCISCALNRIEFHLRIKRANYGNRYIINIKEMLLKLDMCYVVWEGCYKEINNELYDELVWNGEEDGGYIVLK